VTASRGGWNLERSLHLLDRPLDTSESIFHAYGEAGAYFHVQVADVRGPLTDELLLRAVEHVRERHPVLRARISGADQPRWTASPERAPVLEVMRPGTDVHAQMERELLRSEAEAQALWRCVFVPAAGDGTHHILLRMHHSVADGGSSVRVLLDILDACEALATGRPLSPYLPAAPSLDEALAPPGLRALVGHRWRRVLGRLRESPPLLPLQQTASLEERRSRVLRCTVPAPVLDALVSACRRERTTVTGASCAAFLRAVAQHVSGAPHRLGLAHGVSLRPYARGIADEAVGCYSASVATDHVSTGEGGLWPVAREVKSKLRSAMDTGAPIVALHAAKGRYGVIAEQARRLAAPGPDAGRTGALALSNRGKMPFRHLAVFTVRDWYYGSSNLGTGSALAISCGSVHGALSIVLGYVEPLLARETAAAVLAEMHENMLRMAAPYAAVPRAAQVQAVDG
jgi:hypothetical protein